MNDWDKHLPQVMGSYNSTEHSTTPISPHMMLTGHEKSLRLTFLYPEYARRRKSLQTYVRDVIRRQQELNYLCRRNTQQAQIRQKGGFDKRTADAKADTVGGNVCVFQINEVHQVDRVHRLSTGCAAHYKNIKQHNASLEDLHDDDYLMVHLACEVNERGIRDKNDGNEVLDYCDLPLNLELFERRGR